VNNKKEVYFPLGHDVHTHCHVAEVQLVSKTRATLKLEKKSEDTTGAATRRRNISCPTAFASGGTRQKLLLGTALKCIVLNGMS
jgi:hypothetical protein